MFSNTRSMVALAVVVLMAMTVAPMAAAVDREVEQRRLQRSRLPQLERAAKVVIAVALVDEEVLRVDDPAPSVEVQTQRERASAAELHLLWIGAAHRLVLVVAAHQHDRVKRPGFGDPQLVDDEL